MRVVFEGGMLKEVFDELLTKIVAGLEQADLDIMTEVTPPKEAL